MEKPVVTVNGIPFIEDARPPAVDVSDYTIPLPGKLNDGEVCHFIACVGKTLKHVSFKPYFAADNQCVVLTFSKAPLPPIPIPDSSWYERIPLKSGSKWKSGDRTYELHKMPGDDSGRLLLVIKGPGADVRVEVWDKVIKGSLPYPDAGSVFTHNGR